MLVSSALAADGTPVDGFVFDGGTVRYTGAEPVDASIRISFARPTYATRDEIPAELVAAERQILENSDEVRSKPENVREKIVEGMLNKRFYAESVLEEQAWIHDTALTVEQALEQGGLQLLDYAWFSLG